MLKRIEKKSLVTEVTENIIKYITGSELKAGDRLPSEMSFMEIFGISRSVLRESLSRLSFIGIISSEKKNGIILRDPKPFSAIGHMLPLIVSNDDEFIELSHFRYVLESGAGELAISSGTSESVDKIKEVAEKYSMSAEKRLQRNALLEIDEEFHLAIFKAAGNIFLDELSQVIIKHFKNRQKTLTAERPDDFYIKIAQEHLALANSIEKKDLVIFRNLIRNHLKNKQNW